MSEDSQQVMKLSSKNVHLILLMTFCLVAQCCALVFEDKKVYRPPENKDSGVTESSKRYAGNMETCEQDEDCLNPVQKCVVLEFVIYFNVCTCPIEIPNFFNGECHTIDECRLDGHCPHTSYCSLASNSSLGVCQCPGGALRDDGTCPPKTEIPSLAGEFSSRGTTDDDGNPWILEKQILILSVVAVIVVMVLFVGCWRLASRSRLQADVLYRNDVVALPSRQDSPSARRFLSTRHSSTGSSTSNQNSETTTSRPIATSSSPQNTSLFTCNDPTSFQEPPPSYEELFGSSILPSCSTCPSEGHQRRVTPSANSRDGNTTLQGYSYFSMIM